MVSFSLRKRVPRSKTSSFVLATTILLAGLFVILYLKDAYTPRIGDIAYRFDTGVSGTGSNPLFVKSAGSKLTLRFSVDLPVIASRSFYVKPDDCIESFSINGKEVDPEIAKFCDYTVLGKFFDLQPYLQSGNNDWFIVLTDNGGMGGVRITPSETWFSGIPYTLFAFLLIAFYIAWITYVFLPEKVFHPISSIVLGGILLRTAYFVVTPWNSRANDAEAHIDYIRYVAEHFRIPPASGGWEFHQAPLYYFISGIWMQLGQLLGLSQDSIIRVLQFQSLLISVATLIVGVWIGALLFPKKEREQLLFAALLAPFPSLIYHVGSVSNNALSTLLSFLLIAFFLQWWRDGEPDTWFKVVLLLALGFITRVSALMFLPVLALGLFLRRDDASWKQRVRLGFLSLIFLVVATWWLPYIRFVTEQDPTNSLTFSSQAMNSKLRVPTTRETFLTFNPVEILRHPFVNPWRDEERRLYFWEYFFKSAYFGEFGYPKELTSLAVVLLAFAIALIPFAALGLWKALQTPRETFPLWGTSAALIAAHIAYRLYTPFAANQDFRFSLALVPFIIFFIVQGIVIVRKPRHCSGDYFLIGHATCVVLFFMWVIFVR